MKPEIMGFFIRRLVLPVQDFRHRRQFLAEMHKEYNFRLVHAPTAGFPEGQCHVVTVCDELALRYLVVRR